MAKGPVWTLGCMNAIIDGIVINDFDDDREAAQFAANYEARCIRIDPDGSRTLVYDPADCE